MTLRLITLLTLSFLIFLSMSVFSQENVTPAPNNDNTISPEPESDSKKERLQETIGKKIKAMEITVSNFFSDTLGFKNRIKKLETYLAKETKPSSLREFKHRFTFTPFNFLSQSTYTIPEQQESSFNSFYSSFRTLPSQQKYNAYTRPQNGGSVTNYNQLEYRLNDRLRLFYVNRSRHDEWFANANSFTLFDYKDRLIGQIKNYYVRERQERIGLSYYHPINSFLNLGAMLSRYTIHQKFTSESTTIMYSEIGLGYEKSQTSLKATAPGLGFEFYPVRIFIKLFDVELKENNSLLDSMQVAYSRESLQTSHRQGFAELSSRADAISNSTGVNNRTNISHIYTYDSFQYNGTIENVAFVWRFFNFFGIRYGFANEAYNKKYHYYLRFPFVEGLNNPQNLNPLSNQEILLQSIFYSAFAKTKSYYKESYFRFEFSLNYDNFFGSKSANEN